ncbi:MAG: hypothetical protein KFF73_13450 [Cyclobacteriaceae bacterium]|nr:hypothetical protein [Cyclobacteriaceae bacterium]
MRDTLTYILTFMSGAAIGMMVGYLAGSKKEVYVDSHILEMLSKQKDALNKGIEKDLEEMKNDYKNRLRELSRMLKNPG